MNNPLPRTSSLLTRAIAKPSNLQKAEEATVAIPKMTDFEEQKANAIVAQILDSAEASVDAEREYAESLARISEDEAQRAYDESQYDEEEYEDSQSQSTLLPPLEECGLWDPAITLDDSQVEAVRALTDKQYGCLIGAAGTGKTTCEKYLIKNLLYGDAESELEPQIKLRKLGGKQGINIAMVAFTGMAVQVIKSNLPAWMHPAAKTIHSLLEFMPEEFIDSTGKKSRRFVPARHNLNKLEHDIILIDEASMVGLDLWKQLLAACKPGTRIYMIGDLNQLPPIIGMPVFAFALSHWHVSELTKVHRQKEAGANRIIEVAHQILNGKYPTFDETKGNPHWRVAQFTLADKAVDAFKQILNVLNALRHQRVSIEVDPTAPLVWDPYRDRVMTAGNGYDFENKASAMVQQVPINDALSRIILPPNEGHDRFMIDAGREIKVFGIDYRVMATKNEPPDVVDRVTNGMTGVITEIIENANYTGDRKLFGEESHVKAERRNRVDSMLGKTDSTEAFSSLTTDDFGTIDTDVSDISLGEDEGLDEAAQGGGFASHTVVVRFDNGAVRRFASKAGVCSLYLAYASTVAKCQGSQFDTAIIIVHAAEKGQLSREWLYTAVTRASKRVIILKTDYALRLAIGRQKIHGKTLAEKIERYRQMLSEEGVKMSFGGRMRANVPLTIEDWFRTQPGAEYE